MLDQLSVGHALFDPLRSPQDDVHPVAEVVSQYPLESLVEDVEDVLTDRQYAVLTTAYYAGYFDWPRGNTAEEIADSLDISSATFHQHIRGAERKLIGLVCKSDSDRQ